MPSPELIDRFAAIVGTGNALLRPPMWSPI